MSDISDTRDREELGLFPYISHSHDPRNCIVLFENELVLIVNVYSDSSATTKKRKERKV